MRSSAAASAVPCSAGNSIARPIATPFKHLTFNIAFDRKGNYASGPTRQAKEAMSANALGMACWKILTAAAGFGFAPIQSAPLIALPRSPRIQRAASARFVAYGSIQIVCDW
ncbi:MAG: hypothetical protein WDN03_15320 [Rhizomicrobium sp.]